MRAVFLRREHLQLHPASEGDLPPETWMPRCLRIGCRGRVRYGLISTWVAYSGHCESHFQSRDCYHNALSSPHLA